MKCPNCGNENSGKFCVKCGTPLEATATIVQENQTSTSANKNITIQIDAEQLNKHMESVKEVSLNYFNYFLNAVKYPFQQASQVQKQHWINGLITIVLYGFFIGLFTYILLGDLRKFVDASFIKIVIQPMIAYVLFLSLIVLYIFIGMKMMKLNWHYLDVYAKFGTLLVPFVALFIIATVLVLLNIKVLSSILLSLGLITASFLVPVKVLLINNNEDTTGLDRFYVTIIIYILIIITTIISGGIILSTLISAIRDSIAIFFNPFIGF